MAFYFNYFKGTMRVVHLIDEAGPQASGTTLALMAAAQDRLGGVEQKAVLLGGSRLAERARAVGLAADVVMGVPFGRAALGALGLRRRVSSLGAFDVVHCWGIGAFAAAGLAFRSRPIVLTLTVPPVGRAARWLRVLLRESGGHRRAVLACSSTTRRAVIVKGVAAEAVHVLRPAVELSRVAEESREALRGRWCGDGERAYVLALLSDPPEAADACTGALVAAFVGECTGLAGRRVVLLTRPDQRGRLRASRLLSGTRCGAVIVQEAGLDRPWGVLPGCDVALAYGPASSGLSLLWAMGAGVPIVGEATYAISEIVEDRHSALLARPGSAKDLARQVVRLAGDGELRWKLADTARHEAYSYFSRVRYCQSLRGVYEQVAEGRGVEIPELEATGGLRFMGGVS